MKRILLITVILMMVITGCKNALLLEIRFDDTGKLTKEDNVMLGDTLIGKVAEVRNYSDYSIAKIGISSEYEKMVDRNTNFYLMDKNEDAHILAVPGKKKGEPLQDNELVAGKSEAEYYLQKGFGSITETVREFFGSDEWQQFTESLENLVEKGVRSGKKQMDENYPKLQKEINKFIEEMEKEYGEEMNEKVLPKIDSFLNELEKTMPDSIIIKREQPK